MHNCAQQQGPKIPVHHAYATHCPKRNAGLAWQVPDSHLVLGARHVQFAGSPQAVVPDGQSGSVQVPLLHQVLGVWQAQLESQAPSVLVQKGSCVSAGTKAACESREE